jgi:hypothetical protein
MALLGTEFRARDRQRIRSRQIPYIRRFCYCPIFVVSSGRQRIAQGVTLGSPTADYVLSPVRGGRASVRRRASRLVGKEILSPLPRLLGLRSLFGECYQGLNIPPRTFGLSHTFPKPTACCRSGTDDKSSAWGRKRGNDSTIDRANPRHSQALTTQSENVVDLGYSLTPLAGARIQNRCRSPLAADARRQSRIPRKLILDESRSCG